MPKYGTGQEKKLEKRLKEAKRQRLLDRMIDAIEGDYANDFYGTINEVYDIAYAKGFDDGLAGADLLPGMDYDDF